MSSHSKLRVKWPIQDFREAARWTIYVPNEQLLVFLARFSFRRGFAACCEEWLRLSVALAFRLGCALVLEKSTNNLHYTATISKSKLLLTSKVRAQPRRKSQLNGKAQPFLTTGGEAVAKRDLARKTSSFAYAEGRAE